MIALHSLLSADVDGAAIVCRDGGTDFTLADLRARAGAIAQMIGSSSASRVAICLDDPYDFACAFFAALAAARETVIPANAMPGYLRDLGHAYDLLLDTTTLAACERATAPAGSRDARAIDSHAAITLYTSGSSGTAKPVRKSLAQFDAEVRTLQREWGELTGTAVTLSSVPHHHIYGLLFRILWPLAAGRAFDRVPVLDPQQLQHRLTVYGGGIVVSTPAQLMRWPALPDFSALDPAPRVFFSSGAPLPAEAAAAYAAAFGAAPVEIFGSTETGGIAWRRQDMTEAWRPLPGIDVRCEADGALSVRSAHLDHDGWHRTDDGARLDGRGCFELTGRSDRVVKLDGKRVSLPELEARILKHAYIEQAAATVIEGMSRAHVGVVAVLSAVGRQALQADGRIALVATLRHDLGAYFDAAALPRYWRFRRVLPFDGRGKLPPAAVVAVFAPTAEGFELLTEWHSGDGSYYEMRVPATLVHFEGHFPGMPILPGVVQIDWAVRLASREIEQARAIRSINHLKFKAPVLPGAVLVLRLVHDAARESIRFEFRQGERECTLGTLMYGGVA